MEEKSIPLNVVNHEVKLFDRKEILLTGIKRIVSFDSVEFLLETTMGMLLIKGSGLDIVVLDTHNGHVELKGKVNSLEYLDNNKKKGHDNSFIARLFQWEVLIIN